MEFLERVRWTNETPAIYVNIYYEYVRSGADMQYRVKLVVEPVRGQSYFGYPIYAKIFSEGSERTSTTLKGGSPSQWTSNIEWTSDWWTVSNKTSGSSSLAVNIYSGNGSSRNATYNYSMYVAPAYTTVSTWTLVSKTETTATLNWATAHTCSQIRYGKGPSDYTTIDVNSNSGTITITNLDPDTGLDLYFMPKRKDSGLWGDGNANVWKTTYVETYPYPRLDSFIVNYTIGNNYTFSVLNPLDKEMTISIIAEDNNIVRSFTTTEKNHTLTFTQTELDVFYNSIPNKKQGVSKIKVDTTGSTSTLDASIYIVDESISAPTFNNFTYQDTNATTLALTGDSSILVLNYSNVMATISSANKAVAKNGASMVRYNLVIPGNTPGSVDYSSTQDVSITINKVANATLNMYAEDSRGITTNVVKTANVKAYTPITKNQISIERQDNVGESVVLKFDGTFWHQSFGSITNSITNVSYRYKKTTDDEYTTGTTTIVPSTDGDIYSFEGGIVGDISGVGFNAENSYNIEVVVSDELSSTTFTITLGSGTPNMAFVENGIALLGKYDENDTDNKLQIYGDTKITGDTTLVGDENVDGDIDITGSYKINGSPLVIPVLDSVVSTSSTNGVENQAITNYVKPYIEDTGWVDLSAYVNTNNFAIRSGFTPMVRKIGKVVYWKGAIYCTVGNGNAMMTILQNIPNQFRASYEATGGGSHFITNTSYKIWNEGGDIRVSEGSFITPQTDYQGYSLSDICPYIVD